MKYSDITFKDKNPIKRWLQQQRLVAAIRLTEKTTHPQVILDFGSGNGELCKLIASEFPTTKIICYEPTPSLRAEAMENLVDFPQIEFCSDVTTIAQCSVDILFCLEVFEHLPETETENALKQIDFVMSSAGSAIIGVPVEIGLPALYKGIFRMSRRFGTFDATPKNVLLSLFGFPPKDRPASDITIGFPFYQDHMGFDYRHLRTLLCQQFQLQQVTSSPFSILGSWINPEVYLVVKKK